MKRRAPWGVFWFAVSLVLAGLLGAQSYLSYKFPIKQDAFGHTFRTHQGDRLVAYAYLLRSDHKFARVDAGEIDAILEEAARRYGVDPFLARAVTAYESYYMPHAISTTGAMGLMALMPQVVRSQGVRDPFDPRDNVGGGVRLLKRLSDRFHGDPALILAGYNAGEEAVEKYGGVPPYAETTAYVRNVLRLREFFEREASGAPRP